MNGASQIAALMAQTASPDPCAAVVEKARDLVRLYVQTFGITDEPPTMRALASLRGIRFSDERPVHSKDAELVASAGSVMIRVNPDRPETRQNFSIAHEISHTFFPGYSQSVQCRPDPRHTRKLRVNSDLEALCDIGASELLLPDPWFSKDSSSINSAAELERLALRYTSSREATLRRFAETRDWPCAAVFLSWRLKPTQEREIGIFGGQTLFGEDSSAIARAARTLRVDYHVPNKLFETFGHIAAAKSVGKESVFARVASTGNCDESEAMIDFGSINHVFQTWAVPLPTTVQSVGPEGEVSVGAILRPIGTSPKTRTDIAQQFLW